MSKEKFIKDTIKVKVGGIGDASHGAEALESFIKDVAKEECFRRKRESFNEYRENVGNENVELPQKKKLSKQTKALLKANGVLKINNYFEYKTPREVFEEYSAEILEFMKKKVGNSFEIKTVHQMELGELSDRARVTELDGKVYDATRVDVKIKAIDSRKSKSLILLFSPFSVMVFGARKEFSEMGKVSAGLTNVLRENMAKEFGKDSYEIALRNFKKGVKEFKLKNINDTLSV